MKSFKEYINESKDKLKLSIGEFELDPNGINNHLNVFCNVVSGDRKGQYAKLNRGISQQVTIAFAKNEEEFDKRKVEVINMNGEDSKKILKFISDNS